MKTKSIGEIQDALILLTETMSKGKRAEYREEFNLLYDSLIELRSLRIAIKKLDVAHTSTIKFLKRFDYYGED